MENDNQYSELIVRYLRNELTAEEKAGVLEWINLSEQNRQYFEGLIKTWRLAGLNSLENINIDHEWRQFEKKTSFNEIAGKEFPERIDIVADEKPGKKIPVYKIIFSTAIAASLLIALGVGGWLFNKGNNNNNEKQLVSVQEKKKPELVTGLVRQEINTSGKIRKFVLQDGTEVTLYGKSEVSFYEPFINNRRDITLKGKADFRVAKDKMRPFTVYSGRLSTTALGTRFTVSAFKNENFIVVRLFEGKVVVKPDYSLIKRQEKNFYLVAGQELIYNNRLSITKVRRFDGKIGAPKINNEKPFVETLAIPDNVKGSWFMFNNQALSVVFNELQNIYDVEITYSKKDITNMYFIGTYNRTDSVEKILRDIAMANNIKVAKKNNRFIITK